jgi:hypothetical protein
MRGQHPVPTVLPRVKETQYPFCGSGKSRLSPGFEPRNCQPVASRFIAAAWLNKYLKYSSSSPVKYTIYTLPDSTLCKNGLCRSDQEVRIEPKV